MSCLSFVSQDVKLILRRRLTVEVPHVGGLFPMWNVAHVGFCHVGFSPCSIFPCGILPSILFSARPLFHVDFPHVARFPYGIFRERHPPTRPSRMPHAPHTKCFHARPIPCEMPPRRVRPRQTSPHEATPASRDPAHGQRFSYIFPRVLLKFLANIPPTLPISPC